MKTAICLLTADREAYTNTTLTSLGHYNDLSGYILLHADDGSTWDGNEAMANACGFMTCYRSKERRGVMPALRHMWRMAYEMGASHILHLENDIESLRPLPFRRDADSVRLYGQYKGRPGQYPTGPHIMETREPIEWRHDLPNWQRATCHWGAQPSITRADLLVRAIHGGNSLKDVSRQLLRIDTLRPVDNITAHIGDAKTTDAKFSL